MKCKQILIGVLTSFSLVTFSIVNAQEQYTIGKLREDLKNLNIDEEILSADVVVRTTDNIYVLPDSEKQIRFNQFASQKSRCGGFGQPPVIYEQPAGGYEYRWCKGGPDLAFMDIWVYINGSVYPAASADVSCNVGSMPHPVRKIVCS
jgi:hypothetical protein